MAIPGKFTFADFRKLASEIASLRTVDRLSTTDDGSRPAARAHHQSALAGLPGLQVDFRSRFCRRRIPRPLFCESVADRRGSGGDQCRIRPRRLLSTRDRNRREPLYLFMILDSASHRVTLTYPNSTLEGEAMYPSVYVGEIARHYEVSPILSQDSDPVPRGEGEWRSRVADEWRRGMLTEQRARVLLGDNIVERAQLEAKGYWSRSSGPRGIGHRRRLASERVEFAGFLSFCIPRTPSAPTACAPDAGFRSSGLGDRNSGSHDSPRLLFSAAAGICRAGACSDA